MIDVYSSLKPKPLTKISFAELGAGDGGGPRLDPPAGVALPGVGAAPPAHPGRDRPGRLADGPPVRQRAGETSRPRRRRRSRPPTSRRSRPTSGSSSRPSSTRRRCRSARTPPTGLLLERARQTTPPSWPGPPARPVWTHLWERPARLPGRAGPHRGDGPPRPVLRGQPRARPSGRIYEAWVYSDENRAFPYVLTFEDPPPGLVVGPELLPQVRFDGYFLKLLGYRAGDTLRAAPMLVGRLTGPRAGRGAGADGRTPRAVEAERLRDRLRPAVRLHPVRAVFQVRKALAPGRRAAGSTSIVRDEIAPEELADWLESVPDDDSPHPAPDAPIKM